MPATGIRLSIFIDGGYLFKVFAAYSGAGYRYSCKRLMTKLSENYNLEKVHYVNSINLRNAAIRAKQEKFYYGYLKNSLGWEVEILPLQMAWRKSPTKGDRFYADASASKCCPGKRMRRGDPPCCGF
ncbi:MAG: hypothetical protein HY235_29575 [Acidobacteria bacterium]|nr:hypothetical protein [Acidobacteriota bacterium]